MKQIIRTIKFLFWPTNKNKQQVLYNKSQLNKLLGHILKILFFGALLTPVSIMTGFFDSTITILMPLFVVLFIGGYSLITTGVLKYFFSLIIFILWFILPKHKIKSHFGFMNGLYLLVMYILYFIVIYWVFY